MSVRKQPFLSRLWRFSSLHISYLNLAIKNEVVNIKSNIKEFYSEKKINAVGHSSISNRREYHSLSSSRYISTNNNNEYKNLKLIKKKKKKKKKINTLNFFWIYSFSFEEIHISHTPSLFEIVVMKLGGKIVLKIQ